MEKKVVDQKMKDRDERKWFDGQHHIFFIFLTTLIIISLVVSLYCKDYSENCVNQNYGQNLIRNPSGEEGFKYWKLLTNSETGFKIEKPPEGLASAIEKPVPQRVSELMNSINPFRSTTKESKQNGETTIPDMPISFATSFLPCLKEQLIDLEKHGFEPWMLDELKPKITVSEWHATCIDCSSIYYMHVLLLKNPPMNDTMWKTDFTNVETSLVFKENSKNVVAEYFQEISKDYKEGESWQETTHVFDNYGQGLRYILFRSFGRDKNGWRGHYGPKISKAYVNLDVVYCSKYNTSTILILFLLTSYIIYNIFQKN